MMRHLINLVETMLLDEAVIQFDDGFGDVITLTVNPIHSALMRLINDAPQREVRGLSDGKSMYFWSAYDCTHFGAFRGLKEQGFFDGLKWGDAPLILFSIRPESAMVPEGFRYTRPFVDGLIFWYAGVHGMDISSIENSSYFTRLFPRERT